MPAIDDMFAQLRANGRKALMPFVTAGDPDLAFTARVLRLLAASGASMCEVGIPYSDPIADGPVIQESYTRALRRQIRVDEILSTLGEVTSDVATPIVTMVSYAIVLRHGLENYGNLAARNGVAGLIVPDLPVEESSKLAEICRQRDLSLIQLVTPTTPRDRAKLICEASTGFVYYVSIAGITGERRELPSELVENVRWLRSQSPTPICIGFGISQPEHIRQLSPVADGLIVGSALVRRIAEASTRPHDEVLQEVGRYIAELVAAA